MTAQPDLPLPDDPMPPLRLWLDPRGRIGRRTFWLQGVLVMCGMAVLLPLKVLSRYAFGAGSGCPQNGLHTSAKTPDPSDVKLLSLQPIWS